MMSTLLLNCLHLGLVSSANEAAHMLSLSLLSIQTKTVANLLSSSLQVTMTNEKPVF